MSLDSEGYGRIEKISFEAYNESTCLTEAVERFRERTGYYPERVLADQIYRTEVERTFSLSKRCYGMDCITTKLKETQFTSIALSVFVTNLFKIQKRILFAFFCLYRIWEQMRRVGGTCLLNQQTLDKKSNDILSIFIRNSEIIQIGFELILRGEAGVHQIALFVIPLPQASVIEEL